MQIHGIAKLTAEQFINGIDDFFNFCEKIEISCKKSGDQPVNNNQLKSHLVMFKDKKIVFSGFRDKELEADIEAHGGKIMAAISKSTDYLVVKDKAENSTKVNKAIEFGVAILSRDEIKHI